jgi:hypothetical protein
MPSRARSGFSQSLRPPASGQTVNLRPPPDFRRTAQPRGHPITLTIFTPTQDPAGGRTRRVGDGLMFLIIPPRSSLGAVGFGQAVPGSPHGLRPVWSLTRDWILRTHASPGLFRRAGDGYESRPPPRGRVRSVSLKTSPSIRARSEMGYLLLK